MSIRIKFILALLLTSLASTALVGGIAYTRLMHKFDDFVLNNSSRNFRQDVAEFIRTYGSWQEGQRREGFRSFSERRRAAMGLRPPGGLMDAPPPPPQPPVANAQVDALQPGTRPPPPNNMRRPPFRFYLFDAQGHALMNLPPYHMGDPMRQEDRSKVLPIDVDGHVVAYYSPQGQANYSDLDLGYLAAIREALIYGVGSAILLTLVLGVVFGTRLGGALRRLTAAIEAMSDGELKQRVEVKSRDEVGVLASAFNRMSDEIVKNHRELHESHEQIRLQAEQLKELSVRDGLTRLHNRRYFDEQAHQLYELAVRHHHPFTVMIGDIDFFKRINDKFSHAMGDAVLRQVAEILRSKVRTSDIVARYGGEEFVIAFPETPLTQAATVCEALRTHIQDFPWHELHPELKVTMSMGLNANLETGSVDAMLSAADGLLYLAKSSGRNRVCTKAEAPV